MTPEPDLTAADWWHVAAWVAAGAGMLWGLLAVGAGSVSLGRVAAVACAAAVEFHCRRNGR